MSSIVVVCVSLVLLYLGYRLYSPWVAKQIGLDNKAIPPAQEFNDGVDFVPAKHWTILFGHHFASIAGAAPIIGPVIACLFWGWLPAVFWIVIGGTLFGAVHDFTSLTLSLQNKGQSIATITESVMGRSGKIVFSLFTFLALILVVAVFAAVAGKTLATTPQVVLPTFGLVLVAVIIGILMYYVKMSLVISSVIGVVLLAVLIVLGYFFPLSLPFSNSEKWWTIILLIYGLIASVTPVNILLQPRDHLASSVLFLGMLFGFGGIFLSQPEIKAPAIVSFSTVQGMLWPMLFVTVACGAISGFHSLVASGTTSKQVPSMADARIVGFGGMIMESALAILAVIAVTAGLYWKSAPTGLSCPIYQDVFTKGGWIKAFGVGYGEITKVLLSGLGTLTGITMLKTFIMTTLDSATRITRYLGNELFGDTFGIKPMKNKYVATLFVGLCAGALALGNWKAIWPIFGSANQLIASLVLIVVSFYLVQRGKNCFFTAIPAATMLVTTIGAMSYKIKCFLFAEEPKVMLAGIAIAILIMAILLIVKSFSIMTIKKESTA